MSKYVKLAREALENYVLNNNILDIPNYVDSELLENRSGVFVSIKKDGSLRGCIGTISPTQESMAHEIILNAISSGTRDYRFEPVSEDELADLVYSVDVLMPAESISDISELDVKKYGVIVTSGLRRGLLLPNLEGVETVGDQVSIALSKAGISPNEPYELERFEVIRHK